MSSIYSLWGSAQPRFRLPGGVTGNGGRQAGDRPIDVYPGSFAVVNGSPAVVASDAQIGRYIVAGDAISFDGSTWYTVSSLSGTTLTLSSAYAGSTDLGALGYFDASDMWMPEATQTLFRFIPERTDGGSALVRLSTGEELRRATGFRAELSFSWDYLRSFHYKKALLIHSYGLDKPLLVQPHADVRWELEVNDVSEVAPEWPGGKLVGHTARLDFRSRFLIADAPRISSELTYRGFRPNFGL